MNHKSRPICNYEGSAYRSEFWGQGREYEDAVERVALRALLPPSGKRLIEIGAGFGRLAPLYAGYEKVVFFDYALSQLHQARKLWGDRGTGGVPQYIYVAGDFYNLPFSADVFDAVTTIRTLHHASDVPAVLQGVATILAPNGAFVLEFANKQNIKAVFRYLLRSQDWSPFSHEPVEFVKLNFDFHPVWMKEALAQAGLEVRQIRTVSHFRVGFLKQTVPTELLVALDRLLQPTGHLWQLSPSVFALCEAPSAGRRRPDSQAFFRCIVCGSDDLVVGQDELTCASCGAHYDICNGIYDFRFAVDR